MRFHSPRRGFLIFLALALAATAGLMIFMLQMRSRQVNLSAHRYYYTQNAKSTAEGARAILSAGIRESLQNPPPKARLESAARFGRFSELGIYGRMLAHLSQYDDGSSPPTLPRPDIESYSVGLNLEAFHVTLHHEEVLALIPSMYQNALSGLQERQNVQLNLQAGLSCIPGSELADPILKKCALGIVIKSEYRAAESIAVLHKNIHVAPLAPPAFARFTFWHNQPLGHDYDQLITDRLGRPMQNDSGNFIYPYNFPLVMQHASGLGEVSPTDSAFYEGAGFSLGGLMGKEGRDKNRELLLKRGFLYLGNSSASYLKLTPGLEGAGQYFHLFNEQFFEAMETKSGRMDNPVIITDESRPSLLDTEMATTWVYPPPANPLNPPRPPQEGTLKGEVYALYEGFFEDYPGAQAHIPAYTAHSSLLRVYGTPEFPSRAYTVGEATQQIARLNWIGLDLDSSRRDETRQAACLGTQVADQDSRQIWLDNVTEGTFNAQPVHLFPPMDSIWANLHYRNGCRDEPEGFVNPLQFQWDSLFDNYDSYDANQSKILEIPLNQMLDYPLYSHERIPPHGHTDFPGYSFPLNPEDTDAAQQQWPFTASPLHQEADLYYKGSTFELFPARMAASRNHIHSSQTDLIKRGLLQESPARFYLNTGHRHIRVGGDLVLTKPIEVTGNSSLYVDGSCILANGVNPGFLASFNCGEITLYGSDPGRSLSYPYQMFSRGTLRKASPQQSISILGGLGADRLEMSFFTAPATLVYDDRQDPAGAGWHKGYTMIMEDGL